MKIAGAIVLVLILIFALVVVVTRPSDEDLIQEALERSIAASREGKPGGVFEHLSRSFTYNESAITSRRDVGQYINQLKPAIELSNREPNISENTARILTDVHLEIGMLNYRQEFTIPGVEIELAKESGTRWGFIPYPQWRIVSVEAPGFDPKSIPFNIP